MKVHWFLPTSGDGSEVVGIAGSNRDRRSPSRAYLGQIARAADHLGFEGVLTPTGTWCEDAWLTTASLIGDTERLKFLVAFRPGSVSPTLAAQQAATFQRLSGGRLLLNIVTGGDADEQRRFGDWLDHDERYDRTDEFLTVLRGAWGRRPFDFEGDHYRVRGATVAGRVDPTPEIYFGGASPAAELVAARHADVYLMWGETPQMCAERIERVRALAAAEGRSLRFGIRLLVISRDTSVEAWAETDRLLAAMDPKAIEAAQARFATTQSVGQQRMASLHGGRAEDLEVSPGLWAGFGLVRGGAGTGLVGSHEAVADLIEEYHRIGFDEFILSGHPHLEEAWKVGEGVLPLLRTRGLLDDRGADATSDASLRVAVS
jgi:alkanesulfonate monooxygenase